MPLIGMKVHFTRNHVWFPPGEPPHCFKHGQRFSCCPLRESLQRLEMKTASDGSKHAHLLQAARWLPCAFFCSFVLFFIFNGNRNRDLGRSARANQQQFAAG